MAYMYPFQKEVWVIKGQQKMCRDAQKVRFGLDHGYEMKWKLMQQVIKYHATMDKGS